MTSAQFSPSTDQLFLPVVITKAELARYFSCHISTLWRSYVTSELLQAWGYDYHTHLKVSHRISPAITAHIFQHFNVTPDRWYAIVSPHVIVRRSA